MRLSAVFSAIMVALLPVLNILLLWLLLDIFDSMRRSRPGTPLRPALRPHDSPLLGRDPRKPAAGSPATRKRLASDTAGRTQDLQSCLQAFPSASPCVLGLTFPKRAVPLPMAPSFKRRAVRRGSLPSPEAIRDVIAQGVGQARMGWPARWPDGR